MAASYLIDFTIGWSFGEPQVLIFSLSAASLVFVAISNLPISRAQDGFFSTAPQDGHLVPSPKRPIPVCVEFLSSVPEGVDFVPYVKNAFSSVMHNLVVKLRTGDDDKEGVVAVRVRIQKDGSLMPQGAVRVVSSSGTKGMESAASRAIRSAAPFGPLPENFKGESIDLLFTFHFFGSTSEPKPEPKVLPVTT